jgi:hypothetical protein
MALKAVVQDAVETIIDAIDDLADDATYHVNVMGSYDPATDTQQKTVTNISIKGFMYKAKEITQDYEVPGEMTWRFLVASKDLGLAVNPSEQDTITIGSTTYEITQFRTIPNKAGYIFYLRLP